MFQIHTFPASRVEIIPLLAIKQSASVVLPWSTCANIQIFRIFDVFFCNCVMNSKLSDLILVYQFSIKNN